MRNPVESKNGLAYIPIGETAFLIPEKTWLKSYGRNASDGAVSTIILHATVPDVQPWSPERNDEMYWKAGPGKKLEIYIEENKGYGDAISRFNETLHSSPRHVEEQSDQASQGLSRFRRIWSEYDEARAQEDLKRFGPEHVESMRKSAGKPMKDTVYYQLIVDGRSRYNIRCDDERESTQLWMDCSLSFPIGRTLMVRVVFLRDYLVQIVSMADILRARITHFESNGRAYREARLKAEASASRQ